MYCPIIYQRHHRPCHLLPEEVACRLQTNTHTQYEGERIFLPTPNPNSFWQGRAHVNLTLQEAQFCHNGKAGWALNARALKSFKGRGNGQNSCQHWDQILFQHLHSIDMYFMFITYKAIDDPFQIIIDDITCLNTSKLLDASRCNVHSKSSSKRAHFNSTRRK